MKATLLTIATFIAVIAMDPFSGNAQSADKLRPGDDMPGMSTVLKCANGTNTSLAQAAGQNGLLVMFSCNSCPVVIKNQPITNKAIAYAKVHNIGMVIINSNEALRGEAESLAGMKKYAAQQGYTVPYLVDENSQIADMFGASHTPEVYLFNKQHKLVYKGAMNDSPNDPAGYKKMYIADAIDAMIAGKAVDPSTTKSIGCGIKRKA